MKQAFLTLFGLGDMPSPDLAPSVNKAAAALMAEVMAVDQKWEQVEIDRMRHLMLDNFKLPASEADSILDEVLEEQKTRHDLFQFTSVINSQYSETQKFELLKCLWSVAYADNQIDAWEEHIIRRVADLIHLPHRLFIRAKIESRDHSSAES